VVAADAGSETEENGFEVVNGMCGVLVITGEPCGDAGIVVSELSELERGKDPDLLSAGTKISCVSVSLLAKLVLVLVIVLVLASSAPPKA